MSSNNKFSERIDHDDLTEEKDRSIRLGGRFANSNEDGEDYDYVDDQHISTHPSILYE